VLVVDDHADSATSMAMMLGMLGYDARPAFSGAEALAAVRDFSPEVVLLDLALPDLNGFEVARQLRELPQGQALSLVAVTGLTRDADRKRALESGFDAFLVKPADRTQIQAALSTQRPRAR
jgi:CheY-like chemotaxis protein